MENIQNITCPHCQNQFDVENVIAGKIHQKIKSQFDQQKAELLNSVKSQQEALEEAQLAFEETKKRENEIFKQKLAQGLHAQKEQQQKILEEEFDLKIKSLNDEITNKNQKLVQLKEKEIEIEKMKRDMNAMKADIELEMQKKMNLQMLEQEEIIKKRVAEENDMKLKQKDKQLEDQKKLIEEMKRKSEQGSMQLQGEVQELAIENYLMQTFPLDTVTEIKKGVRGGDCLQEVNTRTQEGIGKIYYESKRTKDFQQAWIEKFKTDIARVGADIGVIVTQTYPKGWDRMGQMKGIWVCSYEEFKGLSQVLRDALLRVNSVRASEENKGDKMVMLYDYLTSNEFRQHVEAIVEGFNQMHTDLQKEKNAMQKMWSRREKQIQKVLENTSTMYGSLQGFVGQSLETPEAFELPE